MKIVWLILSVVLIFLAIFLGYFGAFATIQVEKNVVNEIFFVKERVTGDYSQTPVVQDRLFGQLQKDSIVSTKGIGIYYENPEEVQTEELRSDIGCVIEKDDVGLLREKTGYDLDTLPSGNYIIAEFPFRGTLSVIFGVIRVYPKLTAYAEKHDLELSYGVELCDVPENKMIYMMRIAE